MRHFSSFARQNWRIMTGFVLALAVGLWFAAQVFMNFLYFNDPRNVDVDLKPWMTPRYIVMTYDLPRSYVFDFLDFKDERDRGKRLEHVAEDLGLTLDQLTELVRVRAVEYRARTND